MRSITQKTKIIEVLRDVPADRYGMGKGGKVALRPLTFREPRRAGMIIHFEFDYFTVPTPGGKAPWSDMDSNAFL
jgi:hypothetical protein